MLAGMGVGPRGWGGAVVVLEVVGGGREGGREEGRD